MIDDLMLCWWLQLVHLQVFLKLTKNLLTLHNVSDCVCLREIRTTKIHKISQLDVSVEICFIFPIKGDNLKASHISKQVLVRELHYHSTSYEMDYVIDCVGSLVFSA